MYLVGFAILSHYIAKAGFELMVLLPQSPECCDYSYVQPCLAFLYLHKYLDVFDLGWIFSVVMTSEIGDIDYLPYCIDCNFKH
jgi:hypothetical protein